MKKIICMVLCVVMVMSLAACSASFNNTNSNTSSRTVNGITRTESTSTVNGKTTHEISYKDADGNELDPEIGEAAFAAAEQGIENPLEYVLGNEEEPVLYTATVRFENEMEQSITALSVVYIPTGDDTGNLVDEDDPLKYGEILSFTDMLNYPIGAELQITITTENGDGIQYDPMAIGEQENPEDITFVFTQEGDSYYIELR